MFVGSAIWGCTWFAELPSPGCCWLSLSLMKYGTMDSWAGGPELQHSTRHAGEEWVAIFLWNTFCLEDGTIGWSCISKIVVYCQLLRAIYNIPTHSLSIYLLHKNFTLTVAVFESGSASDDSAGRTVASETAKQPRETSRKICLSWRGGRHLWKVCCWHYCCWFL